MEFIKKILHNFFMTFKLKKYIFKILFFRMLEHFAQNAPYARGKFDNFLRLLRDVHQFSAVFMGFNGFPKYYFDVKIRFCQFP